MKELYTNKWHELPPIFFIRNPASTTNKTKKTKITDWSSRTVHSEQHNHCLSNRSMADKIVDPESGAQCTLVTVDEKNIPNGTFHDQQFATLTKPAKYERKGSLVGAGNALLKRQKSVFAAIKEELQKKHADSGSSQDLMKFSLPTEMNTMSEVEKAVSDEFAFQESAQNDCEF